MEKKSITVFSQYMCAELMKRGHKLQGMAQDRKFPDRNVFFFQNTDEIKAHIKEIQTEFKK